MAYNRKCVVAGAGLWGSVVARILAENGCEVLVLEKNNEIGGSCADYVDASTNIVVQKYGAHIFHTSIDVVWEFINRFAKFNNYVHRVVAKHNDNMYFMPFNLSLLSQFFKRSISPEEARTLFKDTSGKKFENFEEAAKYCVGNDIYDAFVKHYTEKQWNCKAEDLDASIFKRLPVRTNFNIDYFNDKYQGMPVDGYSKMIERILQHPLIDVELNCMFDMQLLDKYIDRTVFYSGQLDKLFNYAYGQLQWRSLEFSFKKLCIDDYQGTTVVNYVDANDRRTRTHEFQHFYPERAKTGTKTIICDECPCTWTIDKEAYYPIQNDSTCRTYEKYLSEMKTMHQSIYVGGRLGRFKYFNMDSTILDAIQTANSFLKESK